MANQPSTTDLQEAWNRFASCVERLVFASSDFDLKNLAAGNVGCDAIPAGAREYISALASVEQAFRKGLPIPSEAAHVICITHRSPLANCIHRHPRSPHAPHRATPRTEAHRA